jgi:hypothetical protein
MQTPQGWIKARSQQAARAFVSVIDSRNIIGGIDADQLFEIKTRDTETYGAPVALYTGELEISLGGASGTETTVLLRSDDPVPLHVAGILVEPAIGDL